MNTREMVASMNAEERLREIRTYLWHAINMQMRLQEEIGQRGDEDSDEWWMAEAAKTALVGVLDELIKEK